VPGAAGRTGRLRPVPKGAVGQSRGALSQGRIGQPRWAPAGSTQQGDLGSRMIVFHTPIKTRITAPFEKSGLDPLQGLDGGLRRPDNRLHSVSVSVVRSGLLPRFSVGEKAPELLATGYEQTPLACRAPIRSSDDRTIPGSRRSVDLRDRGVTRAARICDTAGRPRRIDRRVPHRREPAARRHTRARTGRTAGRDHRSDRLYRGG
jgi:hypothetical protein